MIFCVEDDASIRDIEVYALHSTGFQARGFADGESFWKALEQELPSLVVLDVMLPGIDGVTLLRRMRSTPRTAQLPVIMATARGAEYDKVQSLDLGADYYLTKPFGVMELVSCVRAVLRRCASDSQQAAPLEFDKIVLDPQARVVTVNGAKVTLTYKEFELLYLFLKHPQRAFTREELLQEIWET